MSKCPLLVVALALALVPLSARAQAFSADQHILLSEGTLRGSPRIMGLAGAWTGLAEGAEGIPRNPAAPAMRDAKFASDFSWDVGGTMHFLFPWSTKEQDWDNDGSPDQASAATREFLGSQVLYSFAALRYKMVGFGAGFDLQNFLSKQQLEGEGFERYHNLALTHVFGVVSARFWRDQIAVGLGIESTHAFIGYGEQPMGNFLPTPKDSMGFHGWGFLMGGVYRPEDGNWRVGFSYKPALVAHPFRPRADIGGLTAPSGVDVPGRLMLGGAIALGSGRALNITSKDGWVPLNPDDPKSKKTASMMKWLILAQVDIVFPVQGATTVGAFFGQAPAVPAGNRVNFQPRLAIEKELFPELLRLRLGGYLEPPINEFGPAVRPHLTWGFEIGLFKLGHEKLSFALSFDWANLYSNLSVGIVVWK